MSQIKLLVEGSWVNRGTVDEPKWSLMVYPIVTKFVQKDGIIGAFNLLPESDRYEMETNLRNRSSIPCSLLDNKEPARDVTLHNLGEYECDEGYEWSLLLVTKIPYIKDNAYAEQVKHGYIHLDLLKAEEYDPLDYWIYSRLSSLTAPHTITFEPRK